MYKFLAIAILFCSGLSLSSCFKKDVCATVNVGLPSETELASLTEFVNKLDADAIYDSRGFYYRIIKPGSNKRPGICSDIYANYECRDENDIIYYQSSNNKSLMTFDLSDQIYGWRYAFPMLGTEGEMIIYLPPSLATGNHPLKATIHASIPVEKNLIYKLSLKRYN